MYEKGTKSVKIRKSTKKSTNKYERNTKNVRKKVRKSTKKYQINENPYFRTFFVLFSCLFRIFVHFFVLFRIFTDFVLFSVRWVRTFFVLSNRTFFVLFFVLLIISYIPNIVLQCTVIMLRDLAPHQQVAAIILRLGGAARELARTLTPEGLVFGGLRETEFSWTPSLMS